MKKLRTSQYACMMFMMPLLAVFAIRRGAGWGEWTLMLPVSAAAVGIMWAFIGGKSITAASECFGKCKIAAATVFAVCFAATAGGALALAARYAAETIFHTYPAWVVALPIAAACTFGALRGTTALGRAGVVFAVVSAAVMGVLIAVLAFYGRKENTLFTFERTGAAAAVLLADGISAAALLHNAPQKKGRIYIGAYAAGSVLGGAFIAAAAAVGETAAPLRDAGGLVRLGTLITPLTQAAAFFIAVYRISVGIAAAGECAAAVGIGEKRAAIFSGGAAAAFAALFLFTDAPIIYAVVYGLPIVLAGAGIAAAKISAK